MGAISSSSAAAHHPDAQAREVAVSRRLVSLCLSLLLIASLLTVAPPHARGEGPGTITTVAGGGESEEDGPATEVRLRTPHGVVVSPDGSFYVSERGIGNRVRRVEDGFARTLRTGLTMLDSAIAEAKDAGRPDLPGDTAFTLHDTYGFPVDLTIELARERGLGLDRDAFAEQRAAPRPRARAAGGLG
jgi:hypothetical protein